VRKFFMLLCLLAAVTAVAAQDSTDTTTTTTTTANTSSVNIFYVACESQGVINFDGTMDAGYDIYYQLFSAAGGVARP
jgi:hypothetical protein